MKTYLKQLIVMAMSEFMREGTKEVELSLRSILTLTPSRGHTLKTAQDEAQQALESMWWLRR